MDDQLKQRCTDAPAVADAPHPPKKSASDAF